MSGQPHQPHRTLALTERLILSVVLVATAVLFVHQDWLWRWDRLSYDAQLRLWSRPVPQDIVVVAIDEHSLQALGRWPWPREVHADLLTVLGEEQPRAVGLDIIFAEPDRQNPASDSRFVSAVRDLGSVVLPVLMEQPHFGSQIVETLPLPQLANHAAALGHVHIELDPDGIARSLFLREGLGIPYWPHISLAMLQIAGEDRGATALDQADNVNTPGSPLEWLRDNPMLIPFAGPPGHFPRISYNRVLERQFKPGTFKDKYVLVGTTATGLGDALPTPVSGFSHSMPGVEINANILDALRLGYRITPLSREARMLLSGIIAFIPMLLFPYLAPRASLLAAVGLMLGTLVFTGLLLWTLRIWFPPVAGLLAIAIAYPLWSWRRLEHAMRYLSQELDQLNRQRTELSIARLTQLEPAMGFLSQILPVDGWALFDDRGPLSQTGEPFALIQAPLPDGIWMNDGKHLWCRFPRHGKHITLGLRWDTDRDLQANERQLLDALVQELADSEGGQRDPSEVLLARIAQVQQATTQLGELRHLVDDSLSNMADGVLVSDTFGQVLLANTRASWYLRGDDNARITGEDIFSLLKDLHLQDGGSWRPLLRKVLLERNRLQSGARHTDGRDLLVQIAPLRSQSGDINGLVLNFSDISVLKAAERKRNEVLNFLSHDLRSPLVSQLAVLDLIKAKGERADIPAYLGRMRGYTQKTLDLAEQFLQLARAESSEEYPFHELDLVSIALNAEEQVWSQTQAHNIELVQDFSVDEAWIRGEPSLLERALVNLLSNAIKYSPENTRIRIELREQGSTFHCCIVDQGFGIPAQDLPRLFDRFQRVHRKDTDQPSGAGLGLAFVEAVAIRHGGSVEVESEVGKGSRFCLILPRDMQ